MNKMFRIAFWGMGISALGTLPLGTINVAALQISVAEGWYNASMFSLGAALVEVAYVRLSVVGIEWIRRRARLLQYFNWLAFCIVLALAISSLAAANTPGGQGKNVVLNANVNSFVLGLFLSAINPMQIPFWFGWSTVLFGKGVLQPNKTQYNWYCTGIGLGTLIGLAVFVIGGQVLVQNLNANERIVNYTIAGIFFVTALVFLYKIVVQKKTGLPPTPTEPTA